MVTTLIEPVHSPVTGAAGGAPPPAAEDVTRRAFLTGLAAAGLLVAYGDGAVAQSEAGWAFTDDRGVEVALGSRPRRIVVNETVASALWHLGIELVGVFGGAPLTEDNPNLFGVDLSGIESVGQVYGEVNLEKLAALRPDLIVTNFDPRQEGVLFGFVDTSLQEKMEAIAPIVALDRSRELTVVIRRFEELAAALGADLQAPDVVAARQRFEEARDRVRAAVAAKPGLRAVALQAFPGEGIYVARPKNSPGLRHFQGLGLDVVEPKSQPSDLSEDLADFYYEFISFERADTYPADLILIGSEGGPSPLDALATIATWKALPAVEAGQLVDWRILDNWSYPAYTHDLELLADAVERADPDLVP
ncbi:MAG: ABC transporter substrate-binding protein [Egibacteraceae bacterium]